MSRRPPNPAADRAAQNAQTIKSLLKLDGNKSCADCKRNKHPRWASWNLGIFVCIRCSGIHRGMGTHISRVKSVDLDAWTDEQLQSVLVWGNARANKYWEAKLAPGHVPSESKIENFIRTKYDSKRWVMDGPMPDPATLDVEGDDDIPLNLVKEKHNIERSSSLKGSLSQAAGPSAVRRVPQPDLFEDDSEQKPRASTTSPSISRPTPKAEPAPPKQTKPADSLLGLDFFGSEATPPNRLSSAAAAPGAAAQSRPDLKQSILSLYASAPRQQAPQQAQHTSQGSFGGMQSPPSTQLSHTSLGGINDAFSGLSFASPSSHPPQQQKPSAFAGLGAMPSQRQATAQTQPSQSSISGGNFFDAKPAQKTAPPPTSRTLSSSSGFGAFDAAPSAPPVAGPHSVKSSGMDDLFDFASPAPLPPAPKKTVSSPPSQTSVFNLSSPQAPPPQTQTQPAGVSAGAWSNNDAWGSSNAWSSPEVPPKVSPPAAKPGPSMHATTNDFGWGSGGSIANQSIVPSGGGGFGTAGAEPPKVSADEDFGGWSSAAPVTPGTGIAPPGTKPATGFAASEDLFSNVWE